jgi:hypothetical protein
VTFESDWKEAREGIRVHGTMRDYARSVFGSSELHQMEGEMHRRAERVVNEGGLPEELTSVFLMGIAIGERRAT